MLFRSTEATRANVKGNSAGYGNAADERSGGGIFNDGGTVKLEGYCIVSSNTVDKKGPAIYNKGTLQMKDNATVSDGLYIYSDSYAVELTGKLGAYGSAVIDSGNMAEGTTVITKSASLSGTDFESSVKQCSMKNGMYTIQVNAAKTLGTICEGVKVGSTEDLANAIANAGVDGFKITLTGNSNTKIDCSNLGLESESVTHKVHIDLTEYSGTYVPNNDSILYYPKIQEVTLPISNFGAFTFHFADNNTTRVCSDLTTLHIKGGYTDAVDHGMGQANVFINCTKLTDIYYEDIGDNGAVCIGWGMISRYIDQTTNGYINIHLPENTKSIYIVNPQSGDGSVYNSKFNRVRIIYAGSKTKLKQITVTCKNANYNNNEALPCFYSNSTSNQCNWTKGENVATGTWAN